MGQILKSQDPNKFHIQTPENLVGHSNEVHVKLEGQVENALLDTGSTISTLSENFFRKLHELYHCELRPLNMILEVESASGDSLPYLGYVEINLEVPETKLYSKPCLFLVVPDTKYNSRVPILIGTNILQSIMETLYKDLGDQYSKKSQISPPWILAFRCMSWQD